MKTITTVKKKLILFIIILFLLTTFPFSMPSPLYAYEPGNCTAYAQQRRPDLPDDLGDACNWAKNAAAKSTGHGFPVDNIPMAGDIAVFQPSDHDANSSYGHVAYVESVNSNGTFSVSEMNVEGKYIVSKRANLPVLSQDKFIHKKPDLVVTDIKFYKPGTTEEFTPRSGQTLTAYAVLENKGGYKTIPYTVKWFLDGKEVGSGSNPSLTINTCATNNVYFNWQATEGNHSIKFEADYYCVVFESEESNNIYQKEFNVAKATFLDNILNGFEKFISFLSGIFIPDSQAAETFSDKSATIASSQESQSEIQGSVTTETVVTIPSPSKPSLTSPYNWYQSLGEAPTLIWKGDENSISYYVVINSSNTGDIKSGWINSTSWKPNLPNENYIYSWKVKARNSQGVESEWSENRNFSLASTTLKFEGDISFSPPSPSSADQIKIFASTTGWGGVGVTLRVSVNTAPDGSSNGEWRILKELGVPKFNEVDAPEWNTKGWSNGTYRIRVEAKGPDDTNWQNPAVTETIYTLIGKENSEAEINSIETSNTEDKIDSNNLSETKNLVIYKSYDDQNDKNVFIIMNIDGSNKKIIYLDNFLVDYGKINEYSKLKYNLKDANSPFLSSDGRFVLCNESGTWLTHMLDIKENSLKTFEYIDENNELNSGSIRHDPCFSPNTDIIALSGIHTKYTDFNVQLCTFLTDEIENANLKVLTNLSSWVGDPRFSPDGSKIIFSSGNDEIIIIDSDGSNIFNFTDKFGYKGSHPAFSPDGSKIVFMYSDPNHQPYSIATVNLDGTDFKEIYRHELGRCESPSFSSNGTRVIFCAPSGDPTGHYRDIFSIDLQGNDLINLTNSDKIDDCEPECIY